jgi:dihydropyrimidinase
VEFETVIRGGTVVTGEATFRADIGIADGSVSAVALHLPTAREEIDATGLMVMPGMVDVHTHFDHMVDLVGMRNADDYESGSRAGAVGGLTTIINFAFQSKGKSLREAVEDELAHADGNSWIDYGVHLCVTDLTVPGVLEEIPKLAGEGYASVKVFTTTSHYQVPDRDIMRLLEVTRDNGIMLNVHAEDEALVGHLTDGFLSRGQRHVSFLPRARPPLAEELATYRVAQYARHLQSPVYFVHLSSAAALRAVRRAREDGGQIFVETRPVYLYLDESRYELPDNHGNKYVCLPPLRNKNDQPALWEGLRNGEIQTYATDHAPWTSEQKLDPANAFNKIPAGVANVQTSIGMLFAEGVGKGRMSAQQFVSTCSMNPAKLFGMWPRKGTLAPGADADVVLIDPNRKVRINGRRSHSKVDYDPFEGYEGVGWPVLTMLRGRVVAKEGQLTSSERTGRFVKRDRFRPV